MRRRSVLIAWIATLGLAGALGPASTGAIAQSPDRAAIERAFLEELVPALDVPIGWTGNAASCDPGAPSADAQSATLTAINYVRDLAGLDPVTLDAELSRRAQKAALIMHANDDLDHFPPSSWRCWSEEGAEAAGSSNLSLGASGAAAILGYHGDDGDHNVVVGHRRWILRPDAATMGSGSTSEANALWIFGADATGAATPPWVPWPVAGFFPSPLEPAGRWSLSASDPDVTFEGARVAVVGPSGTPLKVNAYPPDSGYASNTLVWEVEGVELPRGEEAATYRVTVTNIGRSDGGAPQAFEYEVSFVSPPLTLAVPPSIVGRKRVGALLRVDPGEWDPQADDFSYQWLRDGSPVGDGGTYYRLRRADRGARISVQVIAIRFGYRDGTATSPVTRRILPRA